MPITFRYRLRTIFIAVSVVCCVLGFVLERGRRQRAIARQIEEIGGKVYYDYDPILRVDTAVWVLPSGHAVAGRPEPRHLSWDQRALACDLTSSIVRLDLSGASPQRLNEVDWSTLSATTVISLGFLDLSNFDLSRLASLKNLRKLELCYTQLDDEGVRRLSTLSTVEEVDLSFNPITDRGLIHLRRIATLKVLNLNGTGITARSISELSRLPNLVELRIADTAISRAEVDSWRQTMPDCNILD